MSARDVFESVNDEDEGGNFQQPEREEGHGVGNEELQEGGHREREDEQAEGLAVGRRNHVLALEVDEYGDGDRGDGDVDEPAGREKAKAINEVVDGLEEKLIDGAFADVASDLPIVLGDRGERVGDRDKEIVRNHPGKRVTGDVWITTLFAGVNGAPEINGGHQRDETEDGAEQKVRSINERVLNSDVDDVPVFFHGGPWRGREWSVCCERESGISPNSNGWRASGMLNAVGLIGTDRGGGWF